MSRLAVRREKVILELEDHFSTRMAKAATSAALLDRTLNDLDGSTADVDESTAKATKSTREYSLAAAIADEKAARLKKTLRDQARASLDAEEGIGGLRSEVDSLTRSNDRADHSINQLTGRLRLFADAAAVLGPSLVPISAVAIPAVTGLASQLGFATLGMGSLVVATRGVGDALKAVNDAALEPTAKNLDKAAEAMAKLVPEARAFVTRFQELRPVLRDIRDVAAAGWFPGLTESLDHLEAVGPRVGAIFEAIGEAGGDLVASGAAAFAGPEWSQFLTFVETNAPRALDELGRTVGNVIKGMAELWMAFDPLNDDFSTWLLDASRSFAEWSAGLSRTDGFREFVDYIRTNGPRVADALGALGTALVEIVEALAPLGGPSLKIIEIFADAIAAIADSDMGTPILAGVAALSLYNRTLAVTAALQAKVAASGGPGGKGSALIGAAPVALGGLAANSLAGEVGSKFELADVNVLQSSPINALNALIQRDADKFILSDVVKRAFTGPDAEEGVAQLSGTLTRSPALLEAMSGFADAAGKADLATEALQGFRREYANLAAVLTQQGTFDAYKASIDAMTDSVERNGKTLNANTAAGRENRASLNSIAEAAIRYSETLIGADRIDFLKKARRAFVDGANKAGGLDKRAREVLATLDALANKKVSPTITVKGLPGAISAVAALRREIAGVRSKTVTVTVNGKRTKATIDDDGALGGGTIPGRAFGGFTGRGGKFERAGDVHRGEVVIPSELVERDRDLLVARYGHLPNMGELGAPAPWTKVSPSVMAGSSSSTTAYATDPAITRELRELRAEVRRGTAVNAAEHNDDRLSIRAGNSIAARRRPRGYVPS